MKVPSVQISTIEIPVADLKRAVAWYGTALGLQCTWSDEHHAMLSGSTDATGPGAQILLVETNDPGRLVFQNSWNGVHHSVLDFRTADLEGLHAHLRAQVARVDDLQPPVNEWAPRGFGFFDSEGNRLGAFTYAS
jgi:catechol 2,3-dioxygenase-like lactoylglutathione lyase family enzyme